MSKNENQKLKLYYLYRLLIEKTDDSHYITMSEILNELEKRGIVAERRSIYRDIDVLNEYMGIEIIKEQRGPNYYYHVGQKQFELAELKLLVDAVQSSKFITERKSDKLIKKITTLASEYEGQQLKRQVYVHGRIKTMNESIFYNIDEIHKAIEENLSITFFYMHWNKDIKLVPKKEDNSDKNKLYEVSPWALTWDDENYYLVAFDNDDQKIKHYRVDKMDKINISDKKREGRAEFKDFNPATYARKNFGMFLGAEESVNLEFPEDMVGVFIDRFGKDIMVRKSEKKGYCKTFVKVNVSHQFFGWVFALGEDVSILGPDNIKEEYKKMLKDTLKKY